MQLPLPGVSLSDTLDYCTPPAMNGCRASSLSLTRRDSSMRGMILALAVALLVAGCGGGGSKGGGAGSPAVQTPTTPTTPTTTRGNPGAVKLETLSPVYARRNFTNVGLAASGMDPSAFILRERRSDGVTIYGGNANDGVSSTRLGLYQYQVQNRSYLDTAVDRPMLPFRVRPTFRHYGDLKNPELYSQRVIDFTFDAIRLVNEALPANRKIRVIRDDTIPRGDVDGLEAWLLSPSREGTILAAQFQELHGIIILLRQGVYWGWSFLSRRLRVLICTRR